jgi:Flp pilus assembly protein TadD
VQTLGPNLPRWLLGLGLLVASCAPLDPAQRADGLPPETEPNSVRLELAHHMIQAGSYDNAVPLLQRVLLDEPGSALAHYYLGCILAARDQLAAAEQELTVALGLRADLAPAMDRLATVLGRAGRYPEALDWHHRAVAAQPGSAAFQNNLAYTLLLAGRGDEAVLAFQRAVILDPADKSTYNNLGFALGRLGRYAEARRAFVQAGGEPLALVNLGVVYEHAGRDDEARQSYQEALQLAPGLSLAQRNLRALDERLGAAAPAKEPPRAPATTAEPPAVPASTDVAGERPAPAKESP